MNKIRMLESRIPPRMRGLRLSSPYVAKMGLDPDGLIEDYAASVRDGKVVLAEGEYLTCGKGIWAVGDGSTALLAALLQDLMDTDDSGASVMYLSADDYLESMRPDGERSHADRAESDHILLLAHVPTIRYLTDWGRGTIASLLTRRFDAGLPTLVASMASPTDFLPPGLAQEAFHMIAIM